MDDIAAQFSIKKLEAKATTKSVEGKSTSAAKYMDPKTGATWSGDSRAPGWIANAKNRDKFLADGKSRSAPVAAKQVKQGNYLRGPLLARWCQRPDEISD
jgi:hypothetical protein